MSWLKFESDELALVLIGGVNYTGQVFDMKTTTAAGHEGAVVIGILRRWKHKIRITRLGC
jgi:kynureninase